MISCPGCGMGLRFDIETQQMKCDYCNSLYDPYRFTKETGDAKQQQSMDTYVWTCPACGGELETADETDAMGFCPYCGGASLLFDRIRKQWRPAALIPFTVTKEQCKAAYLKEARKHPFVSKKYKDPALLESFRGIYMPYWSYRVAHKGTYTIVGKRPTRTDGDYRVTDYYKMTGQIDAVSDGYAHDASMAFDDRISEDLSPFDPEGKKPFAQGFLSGFYTLIGDISQRDFKQEATAAAKRDVLRKLSVENAEIRSAIKRQNLTVQTSQSYVPAELEEAEPVLYPVWFMSYRQGDKLTYAAVNGQTGKVSADLPSSLPKLLAFALAVAAGLFLVLRTLPSVKASAAALITGILFAFGNLLLSGSFSRLLSNAPELQNTPEAAQYKGKKKIWTALSVIMCLIGFALAAIEPARNAVPYAFCILLAVLLIIHIASYIKMQMALARRRPPQMNRKGAASDEK